MPRPRSNQPSVSTLSPGQASYVLERLVADRRISPGEINRYVSDMHREISDLERRLHSLRTATGTSGGAAASSAAPARRGPGRPPGRPPGRRPGRPGRPPAAAQSAPAAAPTGRRRGRPPGGGKKRGGSALSPEQLASRQLQGRYLGLIRQIPASRRGQYQKTAKEKGREAAIKEMQDALKK